MNQSIKINLQALNGAFVTNLKGKTATKRCLVIPVDDANIFVGQKGCYLSLTAIEMQNGKFGDTHIVKQNFDGAVYERMSEEERQAVPILGSVKPLTKAAPSIEASTIVSDKEDLPF